MRNLTNTMVAWTPVDREQFATAGQVALVVHPWPRELGPFPFARDFGGSLRYVQEASLEQRRHMLANVVDHIVSDGIPREVVLSVIRDLEEFE